MATALTNVIQFPTERRNGQQEPTPQQQAQGIVTNEPRPGEGTLCQWVAGLFADAQQARDRAMPSRTWDTNEQAYWGLHWPDSLPSYKSPIVINELKRLVLHELSDLTDLMPTVYVSADPTTGQRNQQVEQAIHAYWQRNFVDMTLLEASTDAAVWPCGFFEVVWNPLLARGQGDLEVRSRAPDTVYPDPYAPDDTRWRYVILREIMDVHEVRLKWPDQGWRVRPDASRPSDTSPLSGVGSGIGSRGMQMASPMYPVSAPVPTQGMDTRVAVYTCYVQDSSTEIVPGVWRSPDGQQHLRRLIRHKFPHGRQIQCTHDVVLYDGPNPYRDGFPIIRMVLQPSLHRFWPKASLVSDLIELQRAGDKAESLTLENMLRLQKAMVIADANSGIQPRTFLDSPGSVQLVTPGARVEFHTPPPLPPDLVQAGSRYRQEMARQMGQAGARQGTAQPGNRSADLTETEISQGMGLTRLRGRFLQQATVRLVEKIFATMADFYRTERLIPYFLDEEWKPLVWQPLVDRDKYAVHVDPNSFTIQSKSMIKRLAIALRKVGAMPVEDLYRILEFPRGQEIAQRLHHEMQMAAQAKQGQKGRK